jgi:hypothetical protein
MASIKDFSADDWPEISEAAWDQRWNGKHGR